jgi:hypothetical protein
MRFFWQTNQNKLARLLNHKSQPGWCGILCCFMYRFINHHQFIPDLDTWVDFCKLNYSLLLEHDKLPKDKAILKETLHKADDLIKKYSGTDGNFEYNVLFSNDIRLHKEDYSDIILKKLRFANKFIFLCFLFKNKSFRMRVPRGVHCISMWNHNNKIYLYDPNFGIAAINFHNKKSFKHSLHKILSLYSESYLNQLIESHLAKYFNCIDMNNRNKFIKWHRRSYNRNAYFGYNFSNIESSKETFCLLYLNETNLGKNIDNNHQFRYSKILRQINLNTTLEPNFEGHYSILKKNGMWD